MRLIADNIIFSLQQTGGISVCWYELLKRMIADGLDLTVLEQMEEAGNFSS
jgi:mannosyltransferase